MLDHVRNSLKAGSDYRKLLSGTILDHLAVNGFLTSKIPFYHCPVVPKWNYLKTNTGRTRGTVLGKTATVISVRKCEVKRTAADRLRFSWNRRRIQSRSWTKTNLENSLNYQRRINTSFLSEMDFDRINFSTTEYIKEQQHQSDNHQDEYHGPSKNR